ncbi:integrase core domain-containing protein [Sporosarcina jeotgali]|uniref:Integrase core domain-containing protein n=1 Tax=Sporosarcina jeotgali TaxID=3020056 RepID=A0ABZ0KWX2_9BACL|nr:integrase core domain-containing protein [Sporosarcina sp. B2O-1]WOV84720.1 integrase core domain-containing protein [Sporosarcina sp. B2O-1]
MNIYMLKVHIIEWMRHLVHFILLYFKSSQAVRMENIALRSQLALYVQRYEKEKLPSPTPTSVFRQLWVFLSKYLGNWKGLILVVQPATVIGWHRTAFKFYWRKKSKKLGRPTISPATIHLIKRIHKDNPLLSPEKIHERLLALGIEKTPAPNTIAKYLPTTKKPPSQRQLQSWKTFLSNHHHELWATDFFTIPTLKFQVLYGLLIINHQSREIVFFGVTTNPTAEWTIQQFRNATPFGKVPKYLLHDNDPIFRSKAFQSFLQSSAIVSKKTAYRSPWQNAYAERAIGIVKRELLDHIIPLNDRHLHSLLREYISYYNNHRTHQGINGKTPITSLAYLPSSVEETKLESTSLLNGLYHSYKKTG